MERAALVYAEKHDFAVFPCKKRSKQPMTAHGCLDASKDPQVIRNWFQRSPDGNVALATGSPSHVIVLDADAKAGGRETLANLEEANGWLPEAPTVLTPGGGLHIYFRDPGGVRNSAGALGAGLDVRGDGGYVIAPPSIYPNGRKYEWEVSSRIGEVELPDVPAWLLAKMKPRAARPFELPDPNKGRSSQ
jgi:hypothetical protein